MPQQKKLGRKKKKRRYEETKLGNLLRYAAPLEYHLITQAFPNAPSANLIEHLGYMSLNPVFRSEGFRRAFVEYRLHGLYCKNTKHLNNTKRLKNRLKIQ